MISVSACNLILNVLEGTPSFFRGREHEDMMEPGKQPTRGRLSRLFAVQGTVRSALARRADAKALDTAIERLGNLSLHLLADIGLEEEQLRPRSATLHQTVSGNPASLPRAEDGIPDQRRSIAAE